ncbi:dienelactone hydrolase family protein [uncultured Chloroflexus sp.]|uniref:dienelactone hydrolase family protein n=1 Tax=uncultured Chloroflexus sp. TaxID=214040 RepID=UPI0026276835|nr:dienelactone hydrolase family protein [uncultured Chloroflexus sp.]
MRRLSRVLGWIVGVIVVVVAGLALSIPLDALIGAGRVEALTNTVIPGPAGPIRAFVAEPTTPGPHPAVIMIHEWWGLRPDIIEKATALAADGYVVIAPDTFRGASTTWIPRAIYQVSTTPPEQVQADLDAVFAWLTARPDVLADRIAVMGFCYGGRTSLLYTLHNPAVAATGIFYGMADVAPEALRQIRGPVLGIFGGADASIPLSEVEQLERNLTAAGVDTRFTVFPGQPHAFVGGMEAINAGGAPGEAWQLLRAFLTEALHGQPSSSRRLSERFAQTQPITFFGALHHRFVCGW